MNLPAPLQAQPEGTPMPDGIRWGSEIAPEPGMQVRSYTFEPTGEALPYAVYVSSKIKPGEKAPLFVALRGFTGTTLTIVRGSAVDLAEEGGYILVGPIGYNNRAGSVATDAAQITAYSEQDVMNVRAMVRKEFAVDENRIYLVGHSQGGGGARHLAEKYPELWAAVALQAPAIFDVEVTSASRILDIPLLVVVGEQDTLKDGNREFADRAAALGADIDFRLYDGLDHGTIILGSLREVFSFFSEHSRQ